MSTPAQAQAADAGLQLPVSAYFDESLYRAEVDRLFAAAPRYVGHALQVPEPGDYLALAHEGDGRVLVRGEHGIELLSNVCRHRQALMLRGRGHTGRTITCPVHRWTYDRAGALVAAPHMTPTPCAPLRRWPLQDWQGLLFEGDGRDVAADLATAREHPAFDFAGYVWDRTELHDCAYNWKTFIEVYLEDYHVEPFHPGLGNFVTCVDLRWQFGAWHSVQTVGLAHALQRPGTPVYCRWHEAVLRQGRLPARGAVWLTYYPTTMVEWYPHALVVSTLHPRGPQRTLNVVEFYYPEEIAAFDRELVEAEQAAYLETCREDDEIALRMDGGRRALWERGDDDRGPYQSPMEDGMRHFHAWLRRRLGDALSGR